MCIALETTPASLATTARLAGVDEKNITNLKNKVDFKNKYLLNINY
jgi:hypothetical protein